MGSSGATIQCSEGKGLSGGSGSAYLVYDAFRIPVET